MVFDLGRKINLIDNPIFSTRPRPDFNGAIRRRANRSKPGSTD